MKTVVFNIIQKGRSRIAFILKDLGLIHFTNDELKGTVSLMNHVYGVSEPVDMKNPNIFYFNLANEGWKEFRIKLSDKGLKILEESELTNYKVLD